MARPQKKGLDYFPFDVGFFNDRAVKALKGHYGSDGITVYIYLLCLIYKENGYYIEVDKDFYDVLSDDLNMNYEKIGQIINFLCERSLFDNKLFVSDKVLTSHGIQLRFQEIVKSRAAKKEIDIDKFWVLSESETQSYIKCTHFQSYSEKNEGYSENNDSFSAEKTHKEKESKSKGKESSSSAAVPKDVAFSETTQRVISHYQQNIAPITPIVAHAIDDWLGEMEEGILIYAIDEAVKLNKRNWKYIEAIIKNNHGAGRTTLAAVEDANRGWKSGKDKQQSVFSDSGTDYDEIEKIIREKM